MAALLSALLLAATPGSHGRLVVSATAGGGWASAPYLGSGLASGGMGELVPAARLDLSFSPLVKAALLADASWLRFGAGDFEARAAAAAAELRLVRGGTEGALGLRADLERYPTGAPAGEGAEGPIVSRSSAVSAAPTLHVRRGRATWWVAASGHLGTSRTASGEVGEQGLSGAAGGAWRAGERLSAFGSGHALRVWSHDEGFALHAAGVEGGLSARPVGALDVTARAGYDHTRFETGVVEDLVRGGVEVAHPVGPVSALVAWSVGWSDAGARGTHLRNAVFAGVRGQLGVASW